MERIEPLQSLCEEADEQLTLICQWAEEISEKYHCALELILILLEGRIERKIDSMRVNW